MLLDQNNNYMIKNSIFDYSYWNDFLNSMSASLLWRLRIYLRNML